MAGSQPIADGSGSDGLPIGSQPLAQVKRKRTRGGRIERCRREAKLIIRIAARKADGAGSTTANERFSRTAATYAEAARRAIDVNAEAHRADIAHRTAAQAATGLPGVAQVGANIPAAVRMAQPQAGSVVQLATQAADIIAAVTEAAAIIAAAIQTDACALAISTSSKCRSMHMCDSDQRSRRCQCDRSSRKRRSSSSSSSKLCRFGSRSQRGNDCRWFGSRGCSPGRVRMSTSPSLAMIDLEIRLSASSVEEERLCFISSTRWHSAVVANEQKRFLIN